MILRQLKYRELVDTIGLVTMIHTIYFKQDLMVIEHVHTTVLIRKKIIEKH